MEEVSKGCPKCWTLSVKMSEVKAGKQYRKPGSKNQSSDTGPVGEDKV